jgi:hypothetical protein
MTLHGIGDGSSNVGGDTVDVPRLAGVKPADRRPGRGLSQLERNDRGSMGRNRGLSAVRRSTAIIARVTVAALALAGLWLVSSRPLAAQDDTPPIVRHAVAAYTAELHGNLAFSRHLSFELHVGPMTRLVRNEVGILMHDGSYIRTKYYSGESNGKVDSDADLRREEDRANSDLASGRGFFKRPVDTRYMADYRFEPAACETCPRGAEGVKFTSVVRDAQHGDGLMQIRKASGRVLSIEYSINRPPDHASQAQVVETFGDALPDLWTCIAVEEIYHGRVGFVSGNATLHYTLDHFRRFSQQDAAVAALTKGPQ